MNEIIGSFDQEACDAPKEIRIVLKQDRMNLGWTHCAQTADLFSHYLAHHFPGTRENGWVDRHEMTHSIGYLVNEIVENAFKFNAAGSVAISTGLYHHAVVLVVSNQVAIEALEKFQNLLLEITSGNPGDLLLERIEYNAQHEKKASGLGYLTLMNDYGVVMGWQFQRVPNVDSYVTLNYMAKLNTRIS